MKTDNIEAIEYKVNGMTCKNCAAGLEASFRADKNVINAIVSFETSKLKIWGEINNEEVKSIIESHGYSLES